MNSEPATEQLIGIAWNLQAGKFYLLASTVMIWYDAIITFAEEVEKIWMKPWTFVTILWAMNRYIPLFGWIVIVLSHQMTWSKTVCNEYILYPESLKLVVFTTIDVIFILRIYAIYARNRTILVSLCLLLVLCIITKIWAFTDGTSLNLPEGLVGCFLVGAHPSSQRFVYTWVADLVFDTVVFAATLFRALRLYKQSAYAHSIPLLTIIMRDGVLYFAVIFASNLATVMLFLCAPGDLKSINAPFSILIASVMVSHLMLNLRGSSRDELPTSTSTQTNAGVLTTGVEDIIIGNLGNAVGPAPDGFDNPDDVDLWYTCRRVPTPPPILKKIEVQVGTAEVVSSLRRVRFPDGHRDEDGDEEIVEEEANVPTSERRTVQSEVEQGRETDMNPTSSNEDERVSRAQPLRGEKRSSLRSSWRAPFEWSWRGDGH